MEFDYIKHTIYLTLSGSRAYGTNREDSDYDYRGAIIPPEIYDTGFLHNFEQKEGLEGYGSDSVAYDLRKFCKLAADCNPNIIEVLFVKPELIVINTPYAEELRKHRHLFLSKRARHSFHGYAYAQLKRLKLHKDYWDKEKIGLQPPKPIREEMGLPPKPRWAKDRLQALFAIPKEMMREADVGYVEKERAYFVAKGKYDKWRQWKENRNPERAALEEQFGMDCKHASHLVRLLNMCEEILTDEVILVTRPDAEFLMGIRNGKWSYEQLMEWVEEKEDAIRAAEKKSTLRAKPDLVALNDLCANLVRSARKDKKI